MGLWVRVGLLYQPEQMFYGFFFRNVFFNTFFLTIETYLSTTGTYITIVGIGHLSRTVDYTSHYPYFQSFHILRGFLYTLDGRAQVIERTPTARTGNVFGLCEFYAGGLENRIG